MMRFAQSLPQVCWFRPVFIWYLSPSHGTPSRALGLYLPLHPSFAIPRSGGFRGRSSRLPRGGGLIVGFVQRSVWPI